MVHSFALRLLASSGSHRRFLSYFLALSIPAMTGMAQQSSTTLTQVVNQAAPTVSVSSNINPSTYLQGVTFTVSVPSDATGTVSVTADGQALGSGAPAAGAFAVSTASLTAGTHNIVATYSGNSDYTTGTGTLSQIVNKASLGAGSFAAASLTSSPNPSTYGQAITLFTAVPTAATGTVAFFSDGAALGSSPVTSGIAVLSTSGLPAGTHVLTATYSGDSNFNPAYTNAVTQIVQLASTATTISVSQNPIPFSSALRLSTTVVPGLASGTVQFFDGSTLLGSSALSTGNASIIVSSLTVGTHSITAVYSGDANYATSASAPVSEVVAQSYSITEEFATPSSTAAGSNVKLASLVSTGGSLPTGSVLLQDGASGLGTATGTEIDTTNLLPYSNDFTQWQLASGATLSASPAAGPDGIPGSAFQLSPASSSSTVPPSLTYTVASGAYAGSSVTASVWVQAPTPSQTTLSLGDGTGSQTTSSCPVTTTWTRCSVTYNEPATAAAGVTVSIASSSPSAAIDVWGAQAEQGAIRGPFVSTSGAAAAGKGMQATLTTASLNPGTHQIVGQYSGDENFTPSSSTPATVIITQDAASLTLASSGSPSIVANPVTFTATFNNADAPTGVLTFYSDAALIGSGNIVNGVATVATSSLAVGTHSITAQFAGDQNNASASAAPIAQVVSQAPTTITATSSLSPSTSGQPVTFAITVSSAHLIPSGVVTIMNGNTALGTVTLDATGKGTFTSSALATGTDLVNFSYTGDTSLMAATTDLNQIVNSAVPAGTPDFELTAGTPSGTVAAGAFLEGDLKIVGVNGFTGTVNLTCSSGLDPTMGCKFLSLAVQASSTGTTTTLTISTMGVTVTTVSSLAPFFLALFWPKDEKQKRRRGALLAAMVAVCAFGIAGCADKNRYDQNNGTPPGVYSVVVTGTSGNLTHSTTIKVTVK